MTHTQELITVLDLAIILLGICGYSVWSMWRSTKMRPPLSDVEQAALSLATVHDRQRLSRLIRRGETATDSSEALLVVGRAVELQIGHSFSLKLGIVWLIVSVVSMALGVAWQSPAAEVIAGVNLLVSFIQIPAALRLAKLARRAEERHREILSRVEPGGSVQ